MPIWKIIDSEANQYLTVSTVGMFNVVDTSNLQINVGHPNGTLATISHIGNLKLTSNVILCDVLVVPGYYVSLLSVNKLITNSKLFGGFDEDKYYIQDLKKEITLGTSSKYGGLYLFDLASDKSLGKVNMVCHRSKQTSDPLPLSDHKSKKRGELIHLDLWGPYRVTRREGEVSFSIGCWCNIN
ncbi:hypothetical protein Tco_0434768 [Tanacetum coccineum]